MARINDEITNVAFESLSADPAAPTGNAPRFYWNNLSKKLRVYDGTQWIDAGGSGAGLGEVNYVVNPSASSNINGWVASGAGITVARTVTGSELPRETLTTSGIKITPVSGTTDYVRYRFQMGDADKGKQLKVQWAQKALSGYAAGDLVLEMYTNAASNYGGAYTQLSVKTSSVPAGDMSFLTTFASTDADYYEMRIRRASGTTAIVLSDVVVGPGSLASVPAITDYVDSSGWTTNEPSASITGVKVKRVGDTVFVKARFKWTAPQTIGATTFFITPPAGLSLDETKIIDPTGADISFLEGSSASIFQDGNTSFVGSVRYYQPTQQFVIGTMYCVNATPLYYAGDMNGTSPITFDTDDELVLNFSYPCSTMSSNVFIAESSVEYASNSDLSDADDTTAFAYGIGGSQFGNFTAQRAKRVRFRSPILPTDKIVVQVSFDAGVTWFDLSNNGTVTAYEQPAGSPRGVALTQISSTDVDVVFGEYRNNQAATFGGAAGGWSDIDNDPTSVWRVCKSSNPLSIGLPSTGMPLGELSYSGFTVGSDDTNTLVTGMSLTLTPGVWTIYHKTNTNIGPTSPTATPYIASGISSDNTLVADLVYDDARYGTNNPTVTGSVFSLTTVRSVVLTAPTTYYAYLYRGAAGDSAAIFNGRFWAIKNG